MTVDLATRCLGLDLRSPIVAAQLRNDAGIIGAAALAAELG